ncbi:MAG: alpha/beta hydrolase, partial [Tepidiformaceae bacterium]
MATLDLDAVELHYDDRGEGIPAFLFISGEASNRRTWQPQIEDLSRDHRCVACDRRGTGDSSATPPFSLAQDVDDAEALVRALGLERLIVVGHRLGGLTALLLNERLPDVIVGVVIGDTPLSPHGIRPADLAQLVRSAPNPAALAERFTASTTSAEARTAVIEAFGSSSPGPSADFVESCELDAERIRELVRAADRKPFMALWPAAAVTDGTLL